MDVKTIAAILLIGRLVSVTFILIVIAKQLKLFRLPVPLWLQGFRKALFGLAIVILIGNLIPIMLDVSAIFADVNLRSRNPSTIGVLYALSNSFTSMISSLFIWLMYKMAATTTLEHLSAMTDQHTVDTTPKVRRRK